MRVLVTGASGQVGSAVARHLVEEGHEVLGLSRGPIELPGLAGRLSVDIGTPDAADRIHSAAAPCEAIVHAAAARDTDLAARSVSLTNCLGTQEMIAVAERWRVERFVYVSGVTVIGNPEVLPVTEEHAASPRTAYHAAKLYGEYLVDIAGAGGLGAATLRLTAPVGPGTPRSRALAVFVRQALRDEPLNVLGNGTRRQDYVDVRDVAVAVDRCLRSRVGGRFNVGRGETISNLELARTCVRVLDSRSHVETGSAPDPEEGLAWEVSIARARTELGYDPRCGLDDSIRAVAAEAAQADR